jgi:hypothetical protein
MPFPILKGQALLDRYLASARVVENDVPAGSTGAVAGQ